MILLDQSWKEKKKRNNLRKKLNSLRMKSKFTRKASKKSIKIFPKYKCNAKKCNHKPKNKRKHYK